MSTVVELRMPKMGESISEATILNWLKQEGETIEADETILEVATDKVDSEVPSPCDGIIKEIKFQPNEVVAVGEVIAILEASGEVAVKTEDAPEKTSAKKPAKPLVVTNKVKLKNSPDSDAFLSPLVISIAKEEGLTIEEVQSIQGSGTDGRIRKSDVMAYVKNRKYPLPSRPQFPVSQQSQFGFTPPPIKYVEGHDVLEEMDRMRQMIAGHMVYSKQTSPHVTAYVEADVTNLVEWRNTNKVPFHKKYGEKLTFTPLFVEAVTNAIKDYPGINASVDGTNVVIRKDINIGMATALPSGNLIVPVVKNSEGKDLVSLAKDVNHLATAARENKLKPEEIQGSTFTISNVGTFGSIMGTPIINQPEVAILALGIIKKRAEVITTDKGDEIAIRSMMYLSLSFDHRVVDGFLGGSFLRRVADNLEQFDVNRKI
ncbi:MAG: 2-oxo acid dehydrogenase subunit E2 [Flavobacteriaceae bacterium]|nr:2-oxo acid dehydrogenase subunit E2 [Flavobacteriaceae bacterium]